MAREHVFWISIIFLIVAKSSGELVHKIIGGSTAEPGTIPYIVSLQKYGKHICGGSILDELHILTAAHCLEYISRPSDLVIQYGVINVVRDKQNRIEVADFKTHDNDKYDIAILTLTKKIIFSENVTAIELPGTNSVENMKVVLAGWGYTEPRQTDGSGSDALQVVEIKIVSDDECDKMHNRKAGRLYLICAGIPEGGKGQCTGDSGGPLVIKGTRIQIGIVSRSKKPEGCASKGYPGVFVRVSSFVDWIKENLTKNMHTEL